MSVLSLSHVCLRVFSEIVALHPNFKISNRAAATSMTVLKPQKLKAEGNLAVFSSAFPLSAESLALSQPELIHRDAS